MALSSIARPRASPSAPPIATSSSDVWRRFVRWRRARSAAPSAAGDKGGAGSAPPPPPPSSSSRRGAVVDPAGTDFFLGPGVAAVQQQQRPQPPSLAAAAAEQKEAERRLYRKVEAAPSLAEAVRVCLAALAASADALAAAAAAPVVVGVEPLCLALFRGAVAVSDGEAICDGATYRADEEEEADADAAALARLQRALTAELTEAATPSTTITPSDAATVLWALASEACSPAASARGRPAADARAVEAIASSAAGLQEEEEEGEPAGWQTADLVSALWGAGTLLRALAAPAAAAAPRTGAAAFPMPATRALAGALAGALARRWDFFDGAGDVAPAAAPSPPPQYPLSLSPPRPRPCAEDLADAAAGVAAVAAAASTEQGQEEDAEPLLRLLESVSSCLHAALCNRHSGGGGGSGGASFGGSGGAAPGAADTAKLFTSLASAALALSCSSSSSSRPHGGWRAAVPSLPRALDALAALASQRARDRHRQMLSRPAHLAAAAKALADLGHGSLAVPELLRLLGREAALGAAGADGLAPPARALTLAERQAIKAAALLRGGGADNSAATGAASASASASTQGDQEQQLSLPPDRAPPTARWRPGEAADFLGAMLRLGYQPPRLMCSALAAAVLKGSREEEEEEGGRDCDDDEEAGAAALLLLAAFADAGWHPGDELAERLFLRALKAAGNNGDDATARLADLLHAWAVLMAAGGGSEAARAAANALCSSAAAAAAAASEPDAISPRAAVRALWSLAALGMLTPERFALFAERLSSAQRGSGAGARRESLSDAQLAAVAEAAALAEGNGALLTLPPAAAELRARCERALAAERAEGLHRATRLSSFARDADALDRRLAAEGLKACADDQVVMEGLLGLGVLGAVSALAAEGRGWRRLERDLAAWARGGGGAAGDAGPDQTPPVLLLLADEEIGGASDDAGGGSGGTSALDHRAGGGLLASRGPVLGGLVLRARLAQLEAFPEHCSSSSPVRVLILPRRQAALGGEEEEEAEGGDDDGEERRLLSRALPLGLL